MKKFSVLLFTILLLFRLAASFSNVILTSPYSGFSEEGKYVYIEPGKNLTQISRQLYDERVVPNRWFFKTMVRLSGKADNIMAGEYYFQQGSSLLQIYNKLIKGEVYLHKLFIPEGADLMDIAEIFQENGICSRDEFFALTSNTDHMNDILPGAKNLEGFLFPDTYYYAKGTKPLELLKMMKQKFYDVFNPLIKNSNSEPKLDVIILASLIEKETSIAEEKPLIASVFYNRLKKNIPLQCDPTIIYTLKKENRYDGNLKRIHLKLNSPYNTYINPGLPPGPICNPGVQSLKAALNPLKTDYLYFVSKNDGTHYFSRSLREHNQAVSKYQKLYWRRKWQKQNETNKKI
jgi:UPF0755 protein